MGKTCRFWGYFFPPFFFMVWFVVFYLTVFFLPFPCSEVIVSFSIFSPFPFLFTLLPGGLPLVFFSFLFFTPPSEVLFVLLFISPCLFSPPSFFPSDLPSPGPLLAAIDFSGYPFFPFPFFFSFLFSDAFSVAVHLYHSDLWLPSAIPP